MADDLAGISQAGYAAPGGPSFNYLDELPYFCAEVLPRLARLGVRAVNRLAVSADEESHQV